MQRAEPVHDKPCKNVRSDVEITSGDCRPILTASFSTRLTALSTFNRAAQTKPIMALTLSVTYNLHPPPDTSAPAGLQPSQTLQTILPDPASVGQKSYYEELRKAVLQTKSALGESLTAWRETRSGGVRTTKRRRSRRRARTTKRRRKRKTRRHDIKVRRNPILFDQKANVTASVKPYCEVSVWVPD